MTSLAGFEKQVGWASLEFQKTTCSCSNVPFYQDKVCLQGWQEFLPKVQKRLVLHCLYHSKFQTIVTKSAKWGNDTL